MQKRASAYRMTLIHLEVSQIEDRQHALVVLMNA